MDATATLAPLPPANEITFELAQSRADALEIVVNDCLTAGVDYGILPGTNAPYLKKSGAERLRARFGIRVSYSLQDKHEDWGTGVCFYRYRASLIYNGVEIGNCEATCTNLEDKFQFQWVEATAPDEETQKQMRRKKTGKWKQVDGEWGWYEREKTSNPFETFNNCARRAQKRAAVGATVDVFAGSAFFAGQIGGRTKKEKRDKAISHSEFWKAAKARNIPQQTAQELATQAINGLISWGQAIAGLPQPTTTNKEK